MAIRKVFHSRREVLAVDRSCIMATIMATNTCLKSCEESGSKTPGGFCLITDKMGYSSGGGLGGR